MTEQFGNGLLVALSALSFSACVFIPIGAPEESRFQPVAEDSFLVGNATAGEVEDLLGKPDLQAHGWWLYRDRRKGLQWGGCVFGYSSGGCGALPRGSTDYFFVLDFDDRNVVSAMEIFMENELCDDRQICYEGSILMYPASPADDAEAKLFRVPPDGCLVYTYSTTDSDSAAGELIIDGQAIGGLVGTAGFYVHAVAPGPHAWILDPTDDVSLPLPIESIRFDCDEEKIIYVRYSYRFWFQGVELVTVDRGQQDILERWMARPNRERDDKLVSIWLRDGEIYVTRSNDTVSAYEMTGDEIFPSWGKSESGEPCGMRAALENYGLSPSGNRVGMRFAESAFGPVQLRTICGVGSDCRFRSVFDGEYCYTSAPESIEFEPRGKLLVLESHGDTYDELYYDKAKRLKKIAECGDTLCSIGIGELLGIANEKR